MNNRIYLADGNYLHMSKLSGKLEDFMSISTSVWENDFCKSRQKIDGSICSECYAAASRWRKQLTTPLSNNTKVLTEKLYEVTDLPYVPTLTLRLESHGDINNLTQARNYIRLAKRNPHCIFTLWTKNHAVMDAAIKIEGKPENMICGVSSLFKNKVEKKKYPWTDFVFTVYTADYATEHNITINCPRKCKTCMKCYTPDNFKNKTEPVYISEVLKADANKIKVEGDS